MSDQTYRDDYTNPESDDYWTDSDTGAASAALLAASAPVIVSIVVFAAHLFGAVAGLAF